MIHDELTRLFARTARPVLPPEFGMNLRRRLRAAHPGSRRHDAVRTWIPRLYWVLATLLLARYWRPVDLSPMQIAVLAITAAAV